MEVIKEQLLKDVKMIEIETKKYRVGVKEVA